MRPALSKSILLKHLNRWQNFSTISFSLGSVLWYKIFGGLRLEVPLDSQLMLIECWAMILEVLLDSRLTLIECWAMELEVRLDSRLMLIECSAMDGERWSMQQSPFEIFMRLLLGSFMSSTALCFGSLPQLAFSCECARTVVT